MASDYRGCPYPNALTPIPLSRSRYSLPVLVDQVHSLPFDKQNRIALISREQQLGFCRLNRFQLHATITSVP